MKTMQVLDKEEQRELVFKEQPELTLTSACKLNNGVIKHTEYEKKFYNTQFTDNNIKTSFFIPASGSGSRMFQFLYDFLNEPNEENRGKTEKFLNSIESFAFFDLFPIELKNRLRKYDIELEDFVSYLLNGDGLGFGHLPKGLIPFHKSGSFILNAFQEHLLQGMKVREENVDFHFTINKKFEKRILKSLLGVLELTGKKAEISTSEQNPDTNSYAFSENGELVKNENGEFLTRPSGHGALLENLNQIDADTIFVKNIDNVQHSSLANHSRKTLQYLGGILYKLKLELLDVKNSGGDLKEGLKRLNIKYNIFLDDESIDKMSENEIETFFKRPLRVCGMVKNEGQPGGGPFWVDDGKMISKQIVEKAQIKMKGEQYRLMVQSQYFNPVLMALSSKNIFGEKINLNDFSDNSKYFIVKKKYQGQAIKFLEKPGLWNGGMANWISVFVEIPSDVFTPVKTVLDLLEEKHRVKEK